MNTKKLTLEDLKLESFLTEIDETKLVSMQGGAGGYGDSDGCSGECNTCECESDEYTNDVNCDPGDGTYTLGWDTEDICVNESYGEFCYDSNALCSEPPVC